MSFLPKKKKELSLLILPGSGRTKINYQKRGKEFKRSWVPLLMYLYYGLGQVEIEKSGRTGLGFKKIKNWAIKSGVGIGFWCLPEQRERRDGRPQMTATLALEP